MADCAFCVAGLKIPEYDFSEDQKEIDELFDPLIQQADEMAQQATKRLGEIKNELKALEAERVSWPLTCQLSPAYATAHHPQHRGALAAANSPSVMGSCTPQQPKICSCMLRTPEGPWLHACLPVLTSGIICHLYLSGWLIQPPCIQSNRERQTV